MYYINQLSDNIKANKAKCFDPAMRFLELQTDFRPNWSDKKSNESKN